jgi:hypothetical protein
LQQGQGEIAATGSMAFDGTKWQAQRVCCFLVAEASAKAQGNDVPLCRLEGGEHPVDIDGGFHWAGDTGLLAVMLAGPPAVAVKGALDSAPGIGCSVVGYAEQPAAEAAPSVPPRQIAPGLDEGLLGDVVGQVRLWRGAAQPGPQNCLVSRHQHLERPRLAAPGPGRQRCILEKMQRRSR